MKCGYVERGALLRYLNDMYISNTPYESMSLYKSRLASAYCACLSDVMEAIEKAPIAEVRPVMRGTWIRRRFSENVFGCECSICHTTWDFKTYYCPNCGADMREVSHEN